MGSKISYLRMFVLMGGIMTVVFGLITAFVPGLYMAWVVRDPWIYRDYEWRIEYLSMQPQIHAATSWRLVSSIGGVVCIISILKDDIRFLRLGFLGILPGIIGLLSPAPIRGGYPETTLYPLPLPASVLTFLGVATMFSSIIYRFGGWYRLTILGMLILAIHGVLSSIIAFFDLHLFVQLAAYSSHEGSPLYVILLFSSLLSTLLGYFLCFLKTFASSSTKHNVDQESQTD